MAYKLRVLLMPGQLIFLPCTLSQDVSPEYTLMTVSKQLNVKVTYVILVYSTHKTQSMVLPCFALLVVPNE